MTLWVLGLNHQTAPVELRERAAFAGEALPRALGSLRDTPQIAEAVLLSTCNRTELYAVAESAQALDQWLRSQAGDLQAICTSMPMPKLCATCSGSPPGWTRWSWANRRSSPGEGRLVDRARPWPARPAPGPPVPADLSVAKRARTDTQIGTNPVSVASAAVRLAQNAFARLDDSTVLLVGAGETIELAARHLSEGKVRRLLIANRTLAHAQELASRHGGVALPLTELDRHLGEADVVFSATAAREPVIHREMVAKALRARRHKPMLLFDLAVPRHRSRGRHAQRRLPLHRR